MAGRTGLINGFYFDKEVFGQYMQEQSCINNLIIASGILMEDQIIADMVGTHGNVGTVPFFLPIDGETDALNDDGETDNVPTAIQGSKQTFMAIARMKAWYENTYTRYLTGKSPLQNLADNLVVPYYKNQWEKVILSITKGIMGVSGMATHKTNLAADITGITKAEDVVITDANKISLTTHIDAGQKALGDNRGRFALFVAHSQVVANYKKQEMIDNVKFYSSVLGTDITVPMIGNMIVLETDTGTVENNTLGIPEYHSYMFGRGVFLTCNKQVHRPYGAKYDDEENGGVEKIYTKQAKVIHPNGFSIKADNIAKESPTNAELATAANWELKFNHKQIAIAEIVTNG